MCAAVDGVTGSQRMGARGDHMFRLLWVQIGKGNQSIPSVYRGQKCSCTSCLFFPEVVPGLAQGELGSRSGVPAPLALSPCPPSPSLMAKTV